MKKLWLLLPLLLLLSACGTAKETSSKQKNKGFEKSDTCFGLCTEY